MSSTDRTDETGGAGRLGGAAGTGDMDRGAHPVVVFVRRLRTRLDELAETPVWSMSAAEQRDALAAMAAAESQLAALRLRVLAQAETSGACVETGAVTAAAWAAVETRATRRAARSDLSLALAVEEHQVTGEAIAAGHVSPAQAHAITHAMAAMPSTGAFAVDPDQRVLAEKHLVALAEHHDADQLRVLGRRILEVIAPDLTEAFEGRLLEAEEAHAARKTSLVIREDHQGLAHGRFQIPVRHAHMLRKAIQALTNPTRSATTSTNSAGSAGSAGSAHSAGGPIDPDLPAPVRDGVAFTQVLEAVQASWLPTHGGTGATIVVTMTLDQLTDRLDAAGVCTTDTGGRISASAARRLACTSGIIPAVLAGKSVVLDAGTKTRLHTEPQRIALGIRDGGCTAAGCDLPPAMCHAHHDIAHSLGGPTSVTNGRLLCGHHHRRIHDPAYTHTTLANNKITFHRRT